MKLHVAVFAAAAVAVSGLEAKAQCFGPMCFGHGREYRPYRYDDHDRDAWREHRHWRWRWHRHHDEDDD